MITLEVHDRRVPLSVSSTDLKGTYYDHKPPGGQQDFSTLRFTSCDQSNNPFHQVDSYLRIRASEKTKSSRLISSLKNDASGITAKALEKKAFEGLHNPIRMRTFGIPSTWFETGEKTFAVQGPKWERFRSLGANLYAIAMDEPLLCCRKHIDKPDNYALEETADFIARVRKQYPEMLIGDIETYLSISLEDHYWWIDTLHKRLAEIRSPRPRVLST